MFGKSFRQELQRRFCDYFYNPSTKSDEYYIKRIPSKTIVPDTDLRNIWTDQELPSFLFETGFLSLTYKM